MPCNEFICPDGVTVPVDSCLKECRLASRCASRAYLLKVAEERRWNGTPSITQLENGPRHEFLKIKENYAINPREDRAFAVLGTTVHNGLADLDNNAWAEQRMANAIASGQFDNYVIEKGKGILTDFKTYGAYALKKVLSGESKKETRQLNWYRILLEASGATVDEMWLEVIVRDGGTYIAKKMGIELRFYRVPIPRLDDNELKAWAEERKTELVNALVENSIPRICNSEESWDGKRCESYCSVKDICVKQNDNTWLKTKP